MSLFLLPFFWIWLCFWCLNAFGQLCAKQLEIYFRFPISQTALQEWQWDQVKNTIKITSEAWKQLGPNPNILKYDFRIVYIHHLTMTHNQKYSANKNKTHGNDFQSDFVIIIQYFINIIVMHSTYPPFSKHKQIDQRRDGATKCAKQLISLRTLRNQFEFLI